jgi:hypothetical protein
MDLHFLLYLSVPPGPGGLQLASGPTLCCFTHAALRSLDHPLLLSQQAKMQSTAGGMTSNQKIAAGVAVAGLAYYLYSRR